MFLRLLVGCWVVGVAVGAACGVAVGIAGGLDNWDRGVGELIIIGTSVGGGWTARLDCGALLGVRRGRLCVTAAGGGARSVCGDGVGVGCVGRLGTALVGVRLLFGVLCISRITAVLTSAIW